MYTSFYCSRGIYADGWLWKLFSGPTRFQKGLDQNGRIRLKILTKYANSRYPLLPRNARPMTTVTARAHYACNCDFGAC